VVERAGETTDTVGSSINHETVTGSTLLGGMHFVTDLLSLFSFIRSCACIGDAR